MLWFIGLGINGPDSLSVRAQNVVADSDIVYLEQFTSPMSEQDVGKIKELVKGQFRPGPRWLVEDGREILEAAKKSNVVLLSYGDPYIATTHIELRVRAVQEKITTKTIHSSSAIPSLIGECGLHYYKVGRTVTIMSGIPATTAYYAIFENLKLGSHTVVLLEYNQDRGFFLEPVAAFESLLAAEKDQVRNVISENTYAVVASRVGFDDQLITAGKIKNLLGCGFGQPPHTIIIPGALHFTESDALGAFAVCVGPPEDNTAKIQKISAQMMKKYVPMVRRALEQITPHYEGIDEFASVLENADLYIKDAEKFFEQGKDELAILSIGYADGLIDALRIAKGIEPELNS